MKMFHYSQQPCVAISKWVSNIIDVTMKDVYDMIQHADDYSGIEMMFELSDCPDKVLSSITSITYMMNRCGKSYEYFKDTINNLSESRWKTFITLRKDVARESIKLYRLLNNKPSDNLLIDISPFLLMDTLAADALVDAWVDGEWELTSALIYSIQSSSIGWKLMHYEYQHIHRVTSADIFYEITRKNSNYHSQCMYALIGFNGSVLKYLIDIDTFNGDGIKLTIQSSEKYKMWKAILHNPCANMVIDYMMENYSTIRKGRFNSKEELRKWIVPNLGVNELINKYVGVDDVNCMKSHFFTNPFSIDILSKWINKNNSTYFIVQGLVSIASFEIEEAALQAIKLIDKCLEWHGPILTKNDWISLINSSFAKDYAFSKFHENKSFLIELLRSCEMIPEWVQFEGEWFLQNLSYKTVKHISVDPSIECKINEMPHRLIYAHWAALFSLEEGVRIGLNNAEYVIKEGALFVLLQSPFISPDKISMLYELTEAYEYTNDEDLLAIMDRPDAYEVDKLKVMAANKNLLQDLLQTWYNPDRLVKCANAQNMEFHSYLELY